MRRTPALSAVSALKDLSALLAVLAATWVCLTGLGLLAVTALQSFGADPLVDRLADQMAGIALVPTAILALIALFQD